MEAVRDWLLGTAMDWGGQVVTAGPTSLFQQLSMPDLHSRAREEGTCMETMWLGQSKPQPWASDQPDM